MDLLKNRYLTRRNFTMAAAAALAVTAMLAVTAIPRKVFGFAAAEHNARLHEALLGSKSVIGETVASMRLLEQASYLCLDQMNQGGQDDLDALNQAKIPRLPKKIEEISFSANSKHRQYTHKGWNFNYQKDYSEAYKERPDRANWPVRKRILLETVNHIFDFSLFAGRFLFLNFGYTKECDRLAKYIYYIHILGDYEQTLDDYIGCLSGERGIRGVSEEMIDFANPLFEVNGEADLFSELQDCIEVLFKEIGGGLYSSLENELGVTAKDVRYFAGANPWKSQLELGVAQQYLDYIKYLYNLMVSRVPNLLERKEYFTKVFPK